MQLKSFKLFIEKVVDEGNRLQKLDLNGHPTTSKKYTQMQRLSFIAAIVCEVILKIGFSDNFAIGMITFFGIFIGLFATIVISLENSSKNLLVDYHKKTIIEQARVKKNKNYLVQFTGLTSYSILIALILVGLLSMPLLNDGFKKNVFDFKLISFQNIDFPSIICFAKLVVIVVHRFFTVYLLLTFFIITIYSITSYFSYLQSEYQKMKIDD